MNDPVRQFPDGGLPEDRPSFVISVAARLVGVHAQTLRTYERMGLVEPARSRGNIRLYSRRDVVQLRWMKSLVEELGINLAGAEVILRLARRVEELERQNRALGARLDQLQGTRHPGGAQRPRAVP